MNNRKARQTLLTIISTFTKKLALSTLAFSLLFGSVPFAFAQEVSESQNTPLTESTETPSSTIPTGDGSTSSGQLLPSTTDQTDTVISPENIQPAIALAGQSGVGNAGTTPDNDVTGLTHQQLPNVNDSGILSYNYPLTIAPGRLGLTPSLSLSYNNRNRDDGVFGVGWSLSIPYIERTNKKGIDTTYTDNYFSSSQAGELALVSGTTYAPRVENGEFSSYDFDGTKWTVVDKKGVTYKYGVQAATRQDDPGNASRVYRWYLEEVRDTNNNYITYEYYKDAGQIYPLKITYTGNGVTAGVLTVHFVRTARTNPIISYATGFGVITNYQITEVRNEINSVWTRKYTLAYTTADNTKNLLINTITESGQDESAVVTTLPATDFDYKTSDPNWTYNSTYNLPETFYTTSGKDRGLRIDDMTGDGMADITCHNGASTGNCAQTGAISWKNNGAGWTALGPWDYPSMGGVPFMTTERFTDSTYADAGLRIFDVNGDGMADLVRSDGTSGTGPYVYLANGTNGWTYSSTWNFPPINFVTNGADNGMRIADINGDGLPDVVCAARGNSCAGNSGMIWINTGSGFVDKTTSWSMPKIGGDPLAQSEAFTDSSFQDLSLRLLDVNGDGLADLVRASQSALYTYLNNGVNGWIYTASWNMPIPFYDSANNDYGVRMADINGDNLPDILCHTANAGASNCSQLGPVFYINTGSGWVGASWNFPNIGGIVTNNTEAFTSPSYQDTSLRIVDINGDGLSDLVRGADGFLYTYINNNSVKADQLTKITYPSGGSSTITYKPAQFYRDGSNNALNPKLPMVLDVVSQIVTDDAFGGTAQTTSYTYEKGLYYTAAVNDRKFAGFNIVTKTDGAGNITKTYYHQADTTDTSLGEYNDEFSKIGKVYRVEQYDNAGNLYLVTVNKWDKYNQATDRDFVKLARQTTLAYDGNGTHKDTATEYTYDNTNGSILTQTEWGEVAGATDGSFSDTGTDKRVTTNLYATNGTTKVVAVYNSTVTDQSAAKVREDKYYYDTLAYGSVSKGNQTKNEKWKTASTYVNTQKTYNATYGNVATETDERGKVTTYTTYDTYNLYPITITNPLSQTTQYLYDYSLGKPKQVTDQNGFVYKTTYDGLDRVKLIQIPDFTTPYSAITKTSYTYTDTSGAVRIQKSDYLDGTVIADTYQYLDGLNRIIQERKKSETSPTYNITNTMYNSVGLVLKRSIPHTGTGASRSTPSATTYLYINYTYDPLQRVLTQSDAIGTTTYAYDDWKTTVTDRNGKVKKYYTDAYNNLIKVDEINGASTYTTNYEWNLNAKLTKVTDASSNIRNFTYDGLGRRLTAQDLHASADATFGTWTYTYDDAGNLTQTISPRSLTTNYTYNDINQQLTEDTTGVAGTEITYTYGGCTNGTGKLCTVTMTSGANTSYTYDSNGNLASEIKTVNSNAYTTSYTYDRQGNIVTVTYPDGAQVKYTYNVENLPEKIERKESGGAFTNVISNFDYNAASLITTQAYPNTVTTTNTYDQAKLYRMTRRLTQNTVPTKMLDLNYTYDNEGNITQVIDSSNTTTSKTANYAYDDVYRMLSATITTVSSGTTAYTHTYTYDALGNILTGPIGTYLYQGNTGVLTANPHAATSINGVTYTYDADGNLTSNGTLANTWNYKDQLTQTVVGGVTINDYYDHNSDRVWHKVGTANNYYPNKYYNVDSTGKKTKQIYAGDQLVATVETVGTTVTPYYNHVDQVNSVTAVTNGTGASVATLDYFPYGNQRISSGTYTSQRQYIGQVYDTNAQLNYLNARYLKSNIGKFISEDPMFWSMTDTALRNPQYTNSYSYGNNNPITLSDPTGKCIWDGCIAEGMLLAAATQAIAPLLTTAYVTDYVGTQLNPTVSTSVKSQANKQALDALALGVGISISMPNANFSRVAPSVAPSTSRASVLQANKAAGAAFETSELKAITKSFPVTQTQLTIKTPSGITTRMDIIARDSLGNICLFECKSSITAPLTKNQSLAFPEIQKSGGMIMGNGKPGFPGNTLIPPTRVNILRPVK